MAESFDSWWAFNKQHFEGKPLTVDDAKEIFEQGIAIALKTIRYDGYVVKKADCIVVLEALL